MKKREFYRHGQKSVVFSCIVFLALILILIQMWLFTAALDNLLAGDWGNAIPASVVSVILLGVNIWMLIGLERMERGP